MPAERRGRAIRVMVNLVNWQQEEPTGCGGGRQPSMDGTSRVTGDRHARFREGLGVKFPGPTRRRRDNRRPYRDRKSTRLNSSHGYISYAVFCLKKKKKKNQN